MGAIHSEVINANVSSPCQAAICTTEGASHAPSLFFRRRMLLAILLPVVQASAFTIDPTSGTNPDGSSRFVDPDEQIHSSFFGGSAVNEDGWADRHSAAPATVGTAQGITFPNWFFPTSPPR
jgi:hypothetical protein